MPQSIQTALTGNDLDGTANNGLVDFAAPTEIFRAQILSVGLVSLLAIDTWWVRLAESLVAAQNDRYYELASGTATQGFTSVGCSIVVPSGWSLFCTTTGATATNKVLLVDWRRIQFTTDV